MATLLSYALTTKADVKESLGIASSDTTKDNLIIRKINQATKAIENCCGRRFLSSTYTEEVYGGTKTNQIVLRQWPVISFSTLEVRDSGLNVDSWETVDSQVYFVDDNSGVIDLLFNSGNGYGRYRATYTAGYATIPEDLAEACASLASYYVQNQDASDVGVAKKKEGQREVSYANSAQSFQSIAQNLGIDSIIESYANYPVATSR